MDTVASTPHAPAIPASSRCGLARLALWLSILAFIPPLGIAAVVLGHIAENRIESSGGALNGKSQARAALWIAYLQLAIFSIAGVVLWNLLSESAQGFRRDATVQRVFREYDQTQPLDAEGAREAEEAARSLTYQFIAIQDEKRRSSEDGFYACDVRLLITTGLKGATDAENNALAARVAESPYLYAISRCTPSDTESRSAGYVLAATPRSPRMPPGSAVYCADQGGVLLQIRGGTSVDCLKNGQPIR